MYSGTGIHGSFQVHLYLFLLSLEWKKHKTRETEIRQRKKKGRKKAITLRIVFINSSCSLSRRSVPIIQKDKIMHKEVSGVAKTFD